MSWVQGSTVATAALHPGYGSRQDAKHTNTE
jgi:hypothetical protein